MTFTTLVDAVIVSAMPGSGKTTLLSLVAKKLSGLLGRIFISLDNEDFGLHPEARVYIANALGFSDPDHKDFRNTVGLKLFFDCMDSTANHLCNIAQSDPSVVGLIHMTEKDPDILITGIPYWEKVKNDYAARGINILGIVVINYLETDEEFIEQFRKRLERGEEGSLQRELDLPKMAEEDLLLRKSFIDKCVQQGFPAPYFDLGGGIEDHAAYLASLIEMTYFSK